MFNGKTLSLLNEAAELMYSTEGDPKLSSF